MAFIEEMNEFNAFVDGHWRCNYYTFPSVYSETNKRHQLKAQQIPMI